MIAPAPFKKAIPYLFPALSDTEERKRKQPRSKIPNSTLKQNQIKNQKSKKRNQKKPLHPIHPSKKD